MGHRETIYQGIVNGNMKAVQEATKAALSESTPAAELLNEVMIPAMAEVGHLFEINEYYVPEMLIAARAMKAGIAFLRPER
jgi:5-methyltetrahydrofolate--homocysteine methyltransferase